MVICLLGMFAFPCMLSCILLFSLLDYVLVGSIQWHKSIHILKLRFLAKFCHLFWIHFWHHVWLDDDVVPLNHSSVQKQLLFPEEFLIAYCHLQKKKTDLSQAPNPSWAPLATWCDCWVKFWDCQHPWYRMSDNDLKDRLVLINS